MDFPTELPPPLPGGLQEDHLQYWLLPKHLTLTLPT